MSDPHPAPRPSQELSPAFRERYEIEGKLGEGGMGVVYLARQKALGRAVAIKFTHATDDETRARFRREGLVLAQLRHPNVIQVFEAGEEGGLPYLVFEVVDGISLADRLDRDGPMAVGESQIVYNATTTPLKVYPGLSTVAINQLSVGSSMYLPQYTMCIYFGISATQVAANMSA